MWNMYFWSQWVTYITYIKFFNIRNFQLIEFYPKFIKYGNALFMKLIKREVVIWINALWLISLNKYFLQKFYKHFNKFYSKLLPYIKKRTLPKTNSNYKYFRTFPIVMKISIKESPSTYVLKSFDNWIFCHF